MGRLPNKSEHLTSEEESKLYDSFAFSPDSSRGLLSAIYYNLGKLLSLRARDEARQLQLENVEQKEDNGDKYLKFHDRSTKTTDGSNVRDTILNNFFFN